MIYRPDIKPPMWGPLSAVQYAVRHNAERLGIDPAGNSTILPLWKMAGAPTNIVDGNTGIIGPDYTAWGPGGIVTTYTTSSGDVGVRGFPFNSDGSSVTLAIFSDGLGDSSGTFRIVGGLSTAGYDDYRLMFRIVNTNDLVFSYKVGSSLFNVSLGSYTQYRLSKSFIATFDGTTIKIIIGGDLVATDTPTGNLNLSNCDFSIGTQSNRSSRPVNTTYYGAFALTSAISVTQAQQLHETPYALLMPVARPFIFDMAGGGGVYTIGKAGLGYSGAPLYGSLFSEIPSLTSSLSGKDAKGSTTVKPQRTSLAFSGQESSTGLLTTIGRSISNFAGKSITIDIVSGTLVSVGQAVFSFVGNAAKGGIKSVIAKFVLTSSTGEVKGNTTTSTPSAEFTYQGNEAKANTKATVDSKSFGLNGRGVIVNGVAEIIRRAVKIIGSSLRRIIG